MAQINKIGQSCGTVKVTYSKSLKPCLLINSSGTAIYPMVFDYCI